MNFLAIFETIKQLFIIPETRYLLIFLAVYILIIQTMGYFLLKGIRCLFKKKKAKSNVNTQPEEVVSAKKIPSFDVNSSPVDFNKLKKMESFEFT